MSTAEQIIAKELETVHGFVTAQQKAAHVVAALTNAGHMLLTPDDVERLVIVLVYTPIHDKTRVPLQVLSVKYDEVVWAAARVAEGGERRG